MENRYLTILEVSQKQAYIFQSNKLKDNITHSAIIAWIMSAQYFENALENEKLFKKEKNLVYSGGGHTVLEFDSKETSYAFTKEITTKIHTEYPEIEVFAATIFYDTAKTPGENLQALTKKLEEKKARRKSAFHQGSFGIEKIDSDTLKPMLAEKKEDAMPIAEEEIDKKLSPKEYQRVNEFGKLGGSKDESNFIAVIHIDGNAMGKRVKALYEKYNHSTWEVFKEQVQAFSKEIDDNFKSAYKAMIEVVEENLKNGYLEELSVTDNFPVRRIITAGDDICFVTEGRIGIECAAAFIRKLNACENRIDKQKYAACAGVAIVHQKYPFYKAYELAEMLCSNAKKYGASLSEAEGKTGSDISAIDWHIEFGELKDTLDEIREEYRTYDGTSLTARPYLLHTENPVILEKNPNRCYNSFKSMMHWLSNDEYMYARGKMKELRQALKEGDAATEHFLKFNRMERFADRDKKMLFDVIELLDTYKEMNY